MLYRSETDDWATAVIVGTVQRSGPFKGTDRFLLQGEKEADFVRYASRSTTLPFPPV